MHFDKKNWNLTIGLLLSRERRFPTYSSLWRNRHLVLILKVHSGGFMIGGANSELA